MNKRLSVLIWAGAGIVILVALFALFVEDNKQLALMVVFSLVACVLFFCACVLIYVLGNLLEYLIDKATAWMERHLGIILKLVAVVLVLSCLDEFNSPRTFLLAVLMLGLIWWKWTIKKEQDKTTRKIALRILDNLHGTRQHALGNLQQAGPNAQQRIKKAIGEELGRRPVDEIALMVLDGGPKMQELMGELLPQMPIRIRWDIKRAIGAEGWRRGEAREIDRLFEENIGQNADIIVLWFFSGEFQHREYVIQKIRETSPEVQRRLEQAIGEKQETLLNNPQTRKPGNAFVYLIRQEDFANKQFFFKIGQTKNLARRLRELQTSNSHLLHLWAAMSFPNKADAKREEKRLHKVYQSWQKRGEWFQGRALEQLLLRADFAPYFNIPKGPLI